MKYIPALTPSLSAEWDFGGPGKTSFVPTIHFKPWGADDAADDADDRIAKITSGEDPTLPDVSDTLPEPLLDHLKDLAAQHLQSIKDSLP